MSSIMCRNVGWTGCRWSNRLMGVSLPTNKEDKALGWVSISEVIGYFTEPALVEWKTRVGAKEAKRIGTIATKIGTRIHELIEEEWKGKFIKFTPKDGNEVKSCIEAYRKWQEDFGFKIEEMEVEVRDEATKLLGHYDIYGQRTLIDIKTSSRINDKMWLQVNQYAKMRGGCDYVAILRLDKSLAIYEFEKRRVDQRCLEVFEAMLITYRYFNNDPMGQGEHDGHSEGSPTKSAE